jgi:DNA-3-methyladenine glycosylase
MVERKALERAAAQPLPELLAGDVVTAAGGLLGCVLARRMPDGGVRRALLVETEAYHMREPGSHSYRGVTPRTAVMFGPPGHLYVYFIYGTWFCCNVVCEREGVGTGVLLRAAAPLPPYDGSDPAEPPLRLSGPGLLCQGLTIDRSCNGVELLSGTQDVWLYRPEGYSLPPITWTRRVGLAVEEDLPWRAVWTGHPAVSKGRPGPVKRKGRRGEA